jgi:hypothetical protein
MRPVDYPVSPDRWRTRALLFAAVAAIELAVLAGLGVVAMGRVLVDEVEGAARAHELAPPAPRKEVKPTAPERPVLEPGETSVVVLNGNGVSGAAAATAARVRALTYVVSGTGNATRSNYARSLVMYRKGYRREAQALAKAAGVGLVGPLDGLRERDLMGAHLALVVGR